MNSCITHKITAVCIGPVSNTELTKCPWHVHLNGSDVYKTTSGKDQRMLPSGPRPAAPLRHKKRDALS